MCMCNTYRHTYIECVSGCMYCMAISEFSDSIVLTNYHTNRNINLIYALKMSRFANYLYIEVKDVYIGITVCFAIPGICCIKI